MNPKVEIEFMLAIDGLDDLMEAKKMFDRITERVEDSFKFNAQSLRLEDEKLSRLEEQVRLIKFNLHMGRATNVEMERYNKELQAANQALSDMTEIGLIKPDPHMLERYERLKSTIDSTENALKKTAQATSVWGETFKEIGLDKQASKVKEFFTVGAQIGLWAGMIAEAAKQSSEWRTQNYAVYGSIWSISSAIRTAQAQTGMLQKEAQEAAKALMQVAIEAKRGSTELERAIEIVGTFSADTGVAADAAALFYKRMQVMGATAKQTSTVLLATRAAMAQFGMSGKDAGVIMSLINDNMALLQARMGGTAAGLQASSASMMLVSGAAVKAGMNISSVQSIFDTLLNDATKLVVLLRGDGLMLNDPGAQFMAMGENAEAALDSLKKVPPFMKNEMAKSIYGMDVAGLKGLAESTEAMKKFAKQAGMSLEQYKNLVKKAGEDGAGSQAGEQLKALTEQYRRSTDPAYAVAAALDTFKNALTEVAAAMLEILAPVIAFFGWIMKIPGAKYVIGTIAVALMALIVVLWAFKKAVNIGSDLANISTAFKKTEKPVADFANTAKKCSEAIGSSLKGIGKGIVEFFKQLKNIQLKDTWQALAVMAAMTGILIGLAYATTGLEGGRLLELSVGIIAMAVAMKILAEAAPAITQNWKEMLKAALVLALFGVALIAIAYAVSLIANVPWPKLLLAGAVLVFLAIAVWVMGELLSKAAPKIGIAIAILLALAFTVILVAVAALIFANALKILNDLDLLKLAVGIGALALVWSIGGGLFLVGAILMAAASILMIYAAGLLIVAMSGLLVAGVVGLAAAIVVSAALFLIGYALASIAPSLEVFADVATTVVGALVLLGTGLAAIGSAIGSGFEAAMAGIRRGMDEVVASSYILFPIAATGVAAGLAILLGALTLNSSGITLLPKLVSGLTGLFNVVNGASGSGQMVQLAKAVGVTLITIASAFTIYAWHVEGAANRVSLALLKIAGSMSLLKLTGMDEMIRTSAMVTVKADLEDRKKSDQQAVQHNELLADIKNGLSTLNDNITKLGQAEARVQLEEIKKLLSDYLPEIADGGRGLAAATNSWNSHMG